MRWVLVLPAAAILLPPVSADVGYDYGAPPLALWLTFDIGPTFDFDSFLGTEFGLTLNRFPLSDFLHLGATYRYATGEVLEPEGESLGMHTLAGLVGYGSFDDPVAYYTGFMLGETRLDGYFAGGELDEWVFTIGFYGDVILPLGDVLGLNFHARDQYIRGERGAATPSPWAWPSRCSVSQGGRYTPLPSPPPKGGGRAEALVPAYAPRFYPGPDIFGGKWLNS
ncbi:MAG TPA: hypothetical protein VM054_10150 [bacterium]|nr:hypothetical protein [bacterium]